MAHTVKYSVKLQGNPLHDDDPKKAYAALQQTGIVEIDELAQHMVDHGCPFSKGTIVGVLTDLGTHVREFLVQGFRVDIGDLGSFRLSATSIGAATLEDFTENNIRGIDVKFDEGRALQSLIDDIDFEFTTSRAAQRAAAAAARAGETSADWTPQTPGQNGTGGQG